MRANPLIATARHQLVEFLLGDEERAARAAAEFSKAGTWGSAIDLAQTWRVIPRLLQRIRSLQWQLSADDVQTLKFAFLKAYQVSAFRAAMAIEAIRALEQAGIPVVTFKGLASIAILYGDAKHRTIHDADILIQKKRLPDALACLERQGFARQGSETLAQYLRFVENSPGFAGNQAVALYGAQACEIDLHWELAGSGLRADEILVRAAHCQLMGSTVPVVDAKDAFLLTIHHSIRENFAIDSICRDLLDLQLWLRHLREAGRFAEGMLWVCQWRGKAAALMVTNLLSSYGGSAEAAQAATLLSKTLTPVERRSAEKLAELFDYQLRQGRVGKDVFYLVHSHPWRQILRGLSTDWPGYRRSMRTIEEKLEENRPLRERISVLSKSMPGFRELRLARELACLKFGAN